MKKPVTFAIAALGFAALVASWSNGVLAQSEVVKSLRGEPALTETTLAPALRKQNTNAASLGRAYRQQPPLIPHNIEKYQINLKVNQCMRCHDWPYNVQEGAPKISETHYTDRNGVALDHVARTRWFCTQCHVPQANARALVENDFKSAVQVK